MGAVAGANTLTASSDSLSGSPVTFHATGSAGVLQVQYNGTPMRAYSMAQLQALTPFTGSAGFRKSTGTIVGPDAVTGVRVTDVVADALGTPLTATQSVNVASVPPDSPYNKSFSYDRLVNLTGFTMYDATANTPVDISGLTGPLAAVVIYSDPAGMVMPAASGPLRFVVADATSENVVMSPSSDSVSNVNQLNVIDPGPATQMALNAGNDQSATAGTAVSTLPSVIVKDGNGIPVPGVSVTFTVTTGGGSATGLSATTNAAGIATVGSWTLGATAGANTLTASSDSLSGSPVTFHATGTAGPAAQIAANAGDGQSASAGTAVGTPPSVIVEDSNANPVSGVSVTFAVASGGGSAKGLSKTTDAAGIATVGSWTLGAAAGANTLTASSGSLSGSPVTFTATGSAGVLQVQYNGQPVRAYSMAELQALTPFASWAGFRKSTGTIVGPDAVTGAKVTDIVADALGTPLTTAESVDVAEASPYYGKTFSYDRLVNLTGFTMYDATSNTPVAMSSLTGPLAAVLIYSDPLLKVMPASSGPLRFVIADAASENVVMSPSSDSVSNVNQLNVIDPSVATQMALNAGDGQSATAGTAVSTKPSVIVTDAHGNPVPGVSVTFSVGSGGGSVTGLAATTNASGIATVGSWILGTTAGANTLTATSGTLSGSPVTFTATGTVGSAAQIAANAGDGQSATAGTTVSTPPSVIVTDTTTTPSPASASPSRWPRAAAR